MDFDIQQLWERVNLDTLLAYATRAGGGLAFLFFGFIVAGWVRRLVQRGFAARNFDPTLAGFISSLARYAVVAMVVLSCLSLFGIETTSFAAALGAVGLAIGLALQGTLGNLAAGLLIVGFRPFRVGDFIRTGGESGTVEELNLFTTQLRTVDNRLIILPNGPVFNNTIENVSAKPIRRCDIVVGVDYAADTERTRQVLHTVYSSYPEVMGEAHGAPADPAVVLTGLGASSVDWSIRVWCSAADFWPLKEKMLERTKRQLDAAGIGIPYPQMDVHLHRPEGVTPDTGGDIFARPVRN